VRQEFFDKDRQSKPVTRAREEVETSGPNVEDELPPTAREREVFELGSRGRYCLSGGIDRKEADVAGKKRPKSLSQTGTKTSAKTKRPKKTSRGK
jgi:hypothetical protein